MPSRGDSLNPMLLERIPLATRTLLDVGCGTGALGQAFARLNPATRLLGLEDDAEAAAIARQRMDEVVVGDVETAHLAFSLTDGIDCIVYGDILEHIRDPWRLLARHAEALSDQGVILICVPNVEHWSFAARLLTGTWDYEDQGLFDRTHLRWFSAATMRRALIAAGLTPYDPTPLIHDQPMASGFTSAIAPALRALGIDPDTYLARASPLQYLWRARRKPREALTIVSSMMEHVGGVSHVRVMEPMRALATDPAISTRIGGPEAAPDTSGDAPRIFILHRPILVGERGLQTIRGLLADGYVIVTEFDDHPDFFPQMQRPDNFVFRGVHAVQTSTLPLADIIGRRNPDVVMFRNAIRALPDLRNFRSDWPLTLFFGGLNREPDWRPLLPELNAVAAVAGERLHFQIVHDRALFDAIDSPYKQFTPTCDYQTYFALLGQSEISFMPLNDTMFNRAKSDLKFIEAASCRVASLASTIVYADTVEDGRTGALFRSPAELREKLLRLVATPGLALALADAARDWVSKHRMLAQQTTRRAEWYRALWGRRAALTSALLARTPELAGAVLSPVLQASFAHSDGAPGP